MKSFTIYLVAFISGAVIMSFEILGSRVLAPDFGSSVFVWGSIIGVFMAGLAAGYFLGGRLSDRTVSAGPLAMLLLLSGLMLFLFPLYGFNVSEKIAAADPGPRLGPFLACTALFFLPTLLMGMITPYCTKMLIGNISKAGYGIGSLYAVSTVGSIIGTVGTAFFLILWTGTRTSLYLSGGILMTTALLAVSLRNMK